MENNTENQNQVQPVMPQPAPQIQRGQQANPQQNKFKEFVSLVISGIKARKILLSIILVILLIIFIILWFFSQVQKTQPAWVISQGLYTTLSKQEALRDMTGGKTPTLRDILTVATRSAVLSSEAVRIGDNQYWFVTGSAGNVITRIPQGVYSVAIVPVPGIDFVNVPKEFTVEGDVSVFGIAAQKGSGQIKPASNGFLGLGSLFSGGKKSFSGTSRFSVVIYKDKDGNGKLEKDDPRLPWAGVVVKLTKKQ